MLIIQPKGGLGNILFILCNGIALSKEYNMKLLVNSEYNDKRKNIKDYKMFNKLRYVDIKFLKILKNVNIYREPNFYYNKIILNTNNIYYIDGYFQSYKYFIKYVPEIKELIYENIRSEINELKEQLCDIKKEKSTVMIHIRRGDYVNLNDIHPVLSQDYYINALDDIKNKISNFKLIVFSDDIMYVKKWELFNNYDTYFVTEEDPEKSFILMTLCDNHIIANSTMSIMAYYMRENINSICYAPKKWFGINGPKYNTDDIMQDNIIKL